MCARILESWEAASSGKEHTSPGCENWGVRGGFTPTQLSVWGSPRTGLCNTGVERSPRRTDGTLKVAHCRTFQLQWPSEASYIYEGGRQVFEEGFHLVMLQANQ